MKFYILKNKLLYDTLLIGVHHYLFSFSGVHIIQYKRAEVLLDYKAQDVEELNLEKGDIIKDIIELENGWWQVENFVNSIILMYTLVCYNREILMAT